MYTEGLSRRDIEKANRAPYIERLSHRDIETYRCWGCLCARIDLSRRDIETNYADKLGDVENLSLLTALHQLGCRDTKDNDTIEERFRDIFGYTETMSPAPKYEIRVWLSTANPNAESLDITGIHKIDCVEYACGDDTPENIRLRYLFRDIKGNCNWRYGPVHKLGKGAAYSKAYEAFAGEDTEKTQISLILSRIINDMEKEGTLTQGGALKIETLLKEHASEIAGLWSDPKSSYVMVMSVYDVDTDEFIYPAYVPAFLTYFKKKIKLLSGEGTPGKKSSGVCALCGETAESLVRIDSVLKFATTDKPMFVPGYSALDTDRNKVFPICPVCQKKLIAGYNVMLNKYTDSRTISGINISVVPETVTGEVDVSLLSGLAKEYLTVGIGKEPFISKYVTKMGDEVILNFFFWEKNQSQVKILFMAQDVPPSRLLDIAQLWEDCARKYRLTKRLDASGNGLREAFRTILLTIRQSEGFNNPADPEYIGKIRYKYTLNTVLDLYKQILTGTVIDVDNVKHLFTDTLCRDIYDKKQQEYIGFHSREMQCVVDFLRSVNEYYRDIYRIRPCKAA